MLEAALDYLFGASTSGTLHSAFSFYKNVLYFMHVCLTVEMELVVQSDLN